MIIKRKKSRLLVGFILCFFSISCNLLKSNAKNSQVTSNSIKYYLDTISFEFNKIELKNKLVFSLLDTIIERKNRTLNKRDTFPFFGIITMEQLNNKNVLVFNLNNDHSYIYDHLDFHDRIVGVFDYKKIAFLICVNKTESIFDELFFLDSSTKKTNFYKLKEGKSTVRFTTLFIKDFYDVQQREFVYLNSVYDRTNAFFPYEKEKN